MVHIRVWDSVWEYSMSLSGCPQGGRSTLGGTKFKIPVGEKKEIQVKRRRVDEKWVMVGEDEVILSKGTLRASVSAAYILLLPFWKTAEEIGMSFYHFVKWQRNKTELSFLDF